MYLVENKRPLLSFFLLIDVFKVEYVAGGNGVRLMIIFFIPDKKSLTPSPLFLSHKDVRVL